MHAVAHPRARASSQLALPPPIAFALCPILSANTYVRTAPSATGSLLSATSDPMQLLHADRFLLYLDAHTWTGPGSQRLVRELTAAMAAGVPILLMHVRRAKG